jgi:hypothetical protein
VTSAPPSSLLRVPGNGARTRRRGLTAASAILLWSLVGPPAEGTTTAAGDEVVASKDAFIDSRRPGANFGRTRHLLIDGRPRAVAFLRFRIGNRASRVENATLELFVRGSGPLSAHRVRRDRWSESTLTYQTAPSLGRAVGGSDALSGSWVQLDVTALVDDDGSFSVAVVGRSGRRLRFGSRESAHAPHLDLTLGASGVTATAGWIVPCTLSHSLPDDPIVAPGHPGAAHLHDFIGGRAVDANATYQEVVAGGTSCSASSGDTGGYWTPALYRGSSKVDPAGSFGADQVKQGVYFRGNNLLPGTVVQTIPPDLRIIAGNADAASPSDNPELGKELYFGCSDNSTGKMTQPPACPTGIITVHIGFPNCWNGRDLDSPDHQSHMAYPDDGLCPSSHPVALPRVIMRLEYPVGTGSGGVTLSSGPPHTLHGDFWNTWQQAKLDHLVAVCLNAGVDCKKI